MKNSDDSRLRVPPSERFAGPQHAFELKQVVAELRAESHEGQKGHRQMTLLQHGAVTMVVFAFQNGGVMADHAARGLVTIQVIEGDFAIETPDATHRLQENSLLVLQPDVRHSVTAHAEGAFLLTVTMEPTE